MFELNNQQCKIKSVNTRTENHGQESVLACDVKFFTTMGNDALNMFDAELKDKFFKEKPKEEHDLADQGTDGVFTILRFPDLQTKQKWDYDGAGYRIAIPHGISGDDDIYLKDVKINNISFDCKQGGSVEFEFRAQLNPSIEESGKLNGLLTESSIDVTLTPPSAEERAQMELEACQEEAGEDDLYFRAVSIVSNMPNVSPSDLSKTLNIDYDEAMDLIGQLEENEIITKPNADGVRFVVDNIGDDADSMLDEMTVEEDFDNSFCDALSELEEDVVLVEEDIQSDSGSIFDDGDDEAA